MRYYIFIIVMLFTGVFAYGQMSSYNGISSKIHDVPEEEILIYPTSATDFVYIDLSSCSHFENVSFQVYNVIGSPINIKSERLGEQKYRIPIDQLSSGHYILRILDQKSKQIVGRRFIKR